LLPFCSARSASSPAFTRIFEGLEQSERSCIFGGAPPNVAALAAVRAHGRARRIPSFPARHTWLGNLRVGIRKFRVYWASDGTEVAVTRRAPM
jgi:hypothetical protein